jgi:predicted PurR-regulated permease PerM
VSAPPAPARPWDITRIVLAVLSIGGLIAASFWVLRPFLPAVVWATMIVVATWPMMRAVQTRLGGHRSLAVVVMTLLMLVIVVAPIAVAVMAIVEHAGEMVAWSRSLVDQGIPEPPAWVSDFPVVGHRIAAEWRRLAATRLVDLAPQATPYLKDIARWLLGQVGGLGALLLHLLLALIVSAILYARGDEAAAGVLAFARRLAGESGAHVAVLSAQAIRAVALGIVVTALLQSFIGGIGLWLTGVPYAALLTAVMFLLGIAQIGAVPVMLGAVVWLYWTGATGWGTVLLVWSIITGSLDNLIRPILIRKGADLPLLLIFAGVLGGVLAFGIIGLFIGPVVLAVTYTLLVAWVTGSTAPGGPEAPAAPGRGPLA